MSLQGGGGGVKVEVRKKAQRSNGPLVTFSFFLSFFFWGDSERGRASGLASRAGCPAGVAASMFREGIHNDQRGCIGHLVKVEDYVPTGLNGQPLVEPADFWFWRARHAGVEASNFAVPHYAAGDCLFEGGFLTAAGGDVPLRRSPGPNWPLLF